MSPVFWGVLAGALASAALAAGCGRMELERHRVDLNKLLEELVDFFLPQAQAQRVQLRIKPSPQPVMADVDPKLIKQALLNLMLNAVQAMPSGGELILSVQTGGNQ